MHRATPADPRVELPADVAIAVSEAKKSYGKTAALCGLTLDIPRGGVTALLGPNGAGKTTLIESICGLRELDSGSVSVLGLDPTGDRERTSMVVGLQVQEFNVQSWVRAREVLHFFAGLYPAPLDIDELLDRFGLTEKASVMFPRLSGGQKRRLAIARALVGDPQIVVLDEPTSGLDPQGQEFLRDEIRRLRTEGRTVLLSTHTVSDAEDLADHVVIVDHGQLVAEGRPTDIIGQHLGRTRVRVRATGERLLAPVGLDSRNRAIELPDGWAVYTDDVEAVRAAFSRANDDLPAFEQRPTSLEDVFLLITGRQLRT